MINWTKLRQELRTQGYVFTYYNDKRKHNRRVKIMGLQKHQIGNYIKRKYPNIEVWNTMGAGYSGFFSGVCFNLNH